MSLPTLKEVFEPRLDWDDPLCFIVEAGKRGDTQVTPEPRKFFSTDEEEKLMKLFGVPDEVKMILKYFSGRIVLAGGALRSAMIGESPKDWDLFTTVHSDSVEDLLQEIIGFLAEHNIHHQSFHTKNALTIKTVRQTIQVCHRWEAYTAVDVINDFDFTHSQLALHYMYESEKWKLTWNPAAINDIQQRRLRYISPIREEDKAGSLLRMHRFLENGWTISKDNLARVVARATGTLYTDVYTSFVEATPTTPVGVSSV